MEDQKETEVEAQEVVPPADPEIMAILAQAQRDAKEI